MTKYIVPFRWWWQQTGKVYEAGDVVELPDDFKVGKAWEKLPEAPAAPTKTAVVK